MSAAHLNPNTRHDFFYLFSVEDGNPNGDPDAGNAPRIDPATGQGLVTDVCVKRKIRDYVSAASDKRVFMERGKVLRTKQKESYDALEFEEGEADYDDVQKARLWMMQNFWDVRMFGAVMSSNKEVKAGKVQGPLQLTFARSLEPINPIRVSITRSMPLTEEKQKEKGNSTFGAKHIVPNAMYKGRGFYSPSDASQVTSDDLALFWDALRMSWELDRSASRGMLTCEKIVVFTHDSPLGNARAKALFESEDYNSLPDGVTVTTL